MLQPADTHRTTLDPAPLPLDPALSELSFGLLQVTYPDGRQEIFDLRRATVHVGRASDNDVILDHELVADHHAQILCDHTGCQILDLGSHIGSQILERETPDKSALASKCLPPKAPHPLAKGTTMLMGEVILIYYPSRRDMPKARALWIQQLERVVWLVGGMLLMLFVLGVSGLWLQSWLSGAVSLANSNPPATATGAAEPTQAPPTPTPGIYIYAVETDHHLNLHIRSAPGLDKPILTKIPYGTVVRVRGEPVPVEPYNWVPVYIESRNLSGWCIIEALRPQ